MALAGRVGMQQQLGLGFVSLELLHSSNFDLGFPESASSEQNLPPLPLRRSSVLPDSYTAYSNGDFARFGLPIGNFSAPLALLWA